MKVVDQILKFRSDRDWEQFYKPKDLAISLAIEAAELLECFQWKTDDEVEALIKNPQDKKKIEEELADIAMYLYLLCNDLNIDLDEAIKEKIEINNKKYPISKSKGNAKKYTEL
ncbi:MAG: nucleotide pyrophosphohydrolase [Clostridiales bacterium]|nr:nucleotide pyrophosphohydrolase [Clostridiales bacterium]